MASAGADAGVSESESMVELDFSEIGVLDDMKAFEAKREEAEAPMSRRAKARAKSQAQGDGQGSSSANSTQVAPIASPGKKAENKAKRGKKDVSAPNAAPNGLLTQPNVQSHDASANGRKSPQSFSDVAQSVLLNTALDSGVKTTPALERKVFVREVLTLVHVSGSPLFYKVLVIDESLLCSPG
jgi:biotin carboxyl carrier protein